MTAIWITAIICGTVVVLVVVAAVMSQVQRKSTASDAAKAWDELKKMGDK